MRPLGLRIVAVIVYFVRCGVGKICVANGHLGDGLLCDGLETSDNMRRWGDEVLRRWDWSFASVSRRCITDGAFLVSFNAMWLKCVWQSIRGWI